MRVKDLRRPLMLIVVILAVFMTAACTDSKDSTSSNSTDEGGGTLTIANVQPFSGTNAAYGPEQQAGCVSAVNLINDAGGVLGNTFECIPVDTRSNPTDAVPAVQQMLATKGDTLAGVVGPSSDEASATIPLLDEATIPYWPNTGDTRYNQQESDYFWRLAVSDDLVGVALAMWADQSGYQKVAIVAGNDPGSQTVMPALKAALAALDIELVAEENVALGQTSYRTEANEVAQAGPEAVIVPTTDPQTVGTFLGELFELGDPVPIIGQVPPLQPRFSKAVKAAIGGDQAYEELFVSVHPGAPEQAGAYDAYSESVLASGDEIDNPSQWAEDPYSMGPYDAVITMALAMLSADSIDPTVFNDGILAVTEAGSGKTLVETFAEGKEALDAGEEIQYVGALGEIVFDAYHNSGGQFIMTKAAGTTEEEVGRISGDQVAEVSNAL